MRMIVTFLSLLLFVACAPRRALIEVEAPWNTSGITQVFGRFAYGHACPVDGLIISAGHIVHPIFLRPDQSQEGMAYSWSDLEGRAGYLRSYVTLHARDLGLFQVMSGEPHYYRHAIEEPSPGEETIWIEFDYDDPYAPKERRGRIVRLVSGHIIIDHQPIQGASGTCLFDLQGEVIGIVVWSAPVASGAVGVAVSVSGQWWPEVGPYQWR